MQTVLDKVLLARARAGEEAAFDALLVRHQAMIYNVAMRFVRSEDAAREVLQEVFLSTWRKLPTFEGRAQISSWLYRVSVNASLMYLRGRGRRVEVALEDVSHTELADAFEHTGYDMRSDWLHGPETHLRSEELRHLIQRAIDQLPIGLRTVFLVRHVDGHSTDETARTLGMTEPAVKTRLHRARLALRERLEGCLDD
jgi:RNA polymerase sigma-70 factor (ECF subfamily)